ncbi:MAG: DUF1697 domain-containing protein [Chloroflexota bacterium]
MKRYISFLRAMNVANRTVKMDSLKNIFSSLGFSNVTTFITSGNVIFETEETNPTLLENTICTQLFHVLGFEVANFVRTDIEIKNIVTNFPFGNIFKNSFESINIAFLAKTPDEMVIKKLMSFKTEIDDFLIHEREIYWLCKKKQSESSFSNAVLEKITQQASTLRGYNTIRRLSELFLPA